MGETHLVGDKEERAIGQDGPDGDVATDAGEEVVLVGQHDGAVPVNGDKGPGQGPRDGRGVDEARVGIVAKVEPREVDEVDDEDQLGPDKVGADKEHDKCKVKKVIENEVAADTGGSVGTVGIAREEVGNVSDLQDEEANPLYPSVSRAHDREGVASRGNDEPVNVGEDMVHGKGAGVEVVLVPEAVANGEAIVGLVDGVVDGDDDGQEPREECEDLVGKDGAGAVRLALAKRVVLRGKRQQASVWERQTVGNWETGEVQSCHGILVDDLPSPGILDEKWRERSRPQGERCM